jgi:hypothetical protein
MTTKNQPDPAVAAQLRKLIRDSKESNSSICRKAGCDPAVLVRFVNEGRGITLATAAMLCGALGVELVIKRRKINGKS